MKIFSRVTIKKQFNNQGFALILTLWVLAILSTLMLTFAFAVNLNLKNAAYVKEGIDRENLEVGAINCIVVQLVYPEDLKKKDSNESSDDSTNKSSGNNSGNSSTGSNTKGGSSANSSDSSEQDKEATKKKAEWYFEVLGDWYINTTDWSSARDKGLALEESKLILCRVEAEDAKFPLSKIFDIKSMPQYSADILENIKAKKKEKKFKLNSVPQLLEIDGIYGEAYDGDGLNMLGFKNIFTEFSNGKIYVSKTNSSVLSFIPEMEMSNAESVANLTEAVTSFDDLESIIGAGSNVKNIAKKWLKLFPEYFRIKTYKDIEGNQVSSEAVVNVKSADIKFLFLKRG